MSQPGPWILRVFKPKRIYLEDGRFPLKDLAFLARHSKTVRHLSAQGKGCVDVAGIHALTQLESLTIRADRLSAPLELSRFPNLKALTLDLDDAPEVDWAEVGPLEVLKLSGGDEAAAEAIAALPHLAKVSLGYSVVPAAFAGPLQDLDIDAPTHLPAEPIGGLAAATRVMLADVAVEDLNLFSGAAELEFLGVLEARYLTSLAGVRIASPESELWLEDCPLLSDLADVVPPEDTEINNCPRLTWRPNP